MNHPHLDLSPEARTLIARIGHTPLLELRIAQASRPGVRLFAKLESGNPGGSIKDRPVAGMLLESAADGTVTFENPSHDFPQRISYRRTAAGIAARIEGLMNGTPRGVDFPFTRCRD